ncbi:SulP family inorganic anion transporter [Streptomyces sp. P01-B04]|uniref:SulP family inorganic anion transporter n=1 Tax=Streptomyces poriferorum TaxID=2798799 RepID=UPI001C5DDA7F|nr:SulP family inorganic anion transporter [Streptomyces poriferorum]MBW5249976.1 SulP family inorganic anion transporter [Streptomyces poriferorum]MBW5255306.1 SulP family inorganic anion transporter [Streptomyces poriferorum]
MPGRWTAPLHGARLGRPTPSDVSSGAVTGLFSIPEGMAYAAIAGFNPVAGLYAGVVPAIVGSLTSRTVLMVTTLTSAIALTSQSVLSDAGLDPKDAGDIALLTVMVGAVMLLMGVLRLGAVMSFVSNAVMTGFSTGIALQIITGVLKDATGYEPQGHNRLVQLGDWLWHIADWQLAATLTALATVALWALAHAVRRLEPVALLIAMVAVSVGAGLLGTDIETVKDIASIPGALPSFTAPDLSAVPDLAWGAVSVALVGLAQAAGIAPSMPNPDGSRSDINGDFRSQGYANLAGGLFQALPSGGSMSRTGVAVSAGARTRWAGIVSGIFLALVVLLCGSLAERIPMPVIGGLILVVGGELIWGKRHDILLVLRTSWMSAGAMVLTFLATTQLPLQQAIVLGAVLSLLLYCAQSARQAGLIALVRKDGGRWETGEPPPTLDPGTVTVLYYAGSSFFAELPRIESRLPATDGARGAVLILVVRTIPDVPSSAMLKLLDRYAKGLADHGGRLILCGVDPSLVRLLERTGISGRLGENGIVPAAPELFGPLATALEDARRWAAARSPDGPPPSA